MDTWRAGPSTHTERRWWAFCTWAVSNQRLASNPLAGLSKADETHVRRQRRALSSDELGALLEAAETRPLRDAQTIRRGKNRGRQLAKVSESENERLVSLGRERALTYKTLVYTGLRKGELASLTVADVRLDEATPFLQLSASHSKNGQAAQIPLRADLADELRAYLAAKLEAYRQNTLADGRSEIPVVLPGGTPLFSIPRDLIRVFDRDLAAAGIAKTDAAGRTVDIHCLRHTFATMLSRARITPRVAQELLRHSDIRLTMGTYTHIELLDTTGAVEALPAITAKTSRSRRVRRTGTDGSEFTAEDDAENDDVFTAERQETRVRNCPPQATTSSRLSKPDMQNTPVNRAQSPSRSSADRNSPKAGDGSRTHNIQLGRLTL